MKSANWESGISLRMSRLFDRQSGKSVVIAMDHSAVFGALKGLEDAEGSLDKVLSGHPDGVLLPGGTARRFQNHLLGRGAPALIIALDFPVFFPYPGSDQSVEEQGVMVSPEEAIRLGADMVKILLIFGREQPSVQARNFSQTAMLVEKCHSLGLPVMLEPTAWGLRFNPKTAKDTGVLRDTARVAAEFGADVVKTDYPENPADFAQIASGLPGASSSTGRIEKAK
jgi:class I fructose-bisphosphate aldolase